MIFRLIIAQITCQWCTENGISFRFKNDQTKEINKWYSHLKTKFQSFVIEFCFKIVLQCWKIFGRNFFGFGRNRNLADTGSFGRNCSRNLSFGRPLSSIFWITDILFASSTHDYISWESYAKRYLRVNWKRISAQMYRKCNLVSQCLFFI